MAGHWRRTSPRQRQAARLRQARAHCSASRRDHGRSGRCRSACGRARAPPACREALSAGPQPGLAPGSRRSPGSATMARRVPAARRPGRAGQGRPAWRGATMSCRCARRIFDWLITFPGFYFRLKSFSLEFYFCY
ncbi:protein of unknown function [Rhodovastum atsumiense]|nr:protein of unknown function [Rhodovastum atsumiense]